MSTSYWLDRSPSSEKKTFDVVIVGAGIAGASAAYWLKKEDPNLNIAIVEKHRVGFGATGRNAGFITCGSVEHFNRLVGTHGKEKALEIWRYSEKNLELLKSELDVSKIKGFRQEGTFSLASEEKEFVELKEIHNLMNDLDIDVEVLESRDIEKRLGAVEFVGGIKYLKDAEVNPISLVTTILESAQVPVLEDTEVFDIEEGRGTRIVKTDNGDFECDMVVLALNGYSALLNPYFEDKISATRGQILATEPVEKFMEGPCYCNFVLDYFRQLETGELLIGGFRQIEKDSEVGYSDHISPAIQDALEKFFRKHLPKFANKKITHRWSGIMGFSSDGHPMVGSLPNDPQTFFMGGFTAHGLGLAFHTGKCLTDSIFGRPIPDFVSAKRF